MSSIKILVTGATGYIGGRLVPRLLERGYNVRCFVRDSARIQGRNWMSYVDIVMGDALQYDSLLPALKGIDVAFYFIHSLATGYSHFVERDRQAAENFARAAKACGVNRIIYLGGLEPRGNRRSPHLLSRIETGHCLRASDIPVTELRAGVVVGSGSLSFELIRSITERVPVMICPKWVQTPTQPIAIRTVLAYLVQALEMPESAGRLIDIGGRDILSYSDMFRIYARIRGLRRWIFEVPVMITRLGAFLTSLVTPFPLKIIYPLIEGLNNEVVVRNDDAQQLFDVQPISYEQAVHLALNRFTAGTMETTWHDAFSSSIVDGASLETMENMEGMIRFQKDVQVQASPFAAFSVIKTLGGDTGWLYASALWRIRGFIDLFVGGVGLRRGRRHPTDIHVGDALDFWRVETLVNDRLLRLRAEMKVPGKAWLQFSVKPVGNLHVRVRQTAFFEPKGLWGLIYWYILYPIHYVIFRGMMRELCNRIEATRVAQQTEA